MFPLSRSRAGLENGIVLPSAPGLGMGRRLWLQSTVSLHQELVVRRNAGATSCCGFAGMAINGTDANSSHAA